MCNLNVLDLEYFGSVRDEVIEGAFFSVPVVTVKTNTQVDIGVRSNTSVAPAPKIGFSYSNAVAAGYATGLAVSVNGQPTLVVNAETSIV